MIKIERAKLKDALRMTLFIFLLALVVFFTHTDVEELCSDFSSTAFESDMLTGASANNTYDETTLLRFAICEDSKSEASAKCALTRCEGSEDLVRSNRYRLFSKFFHYIRLAVIANLLEEILGIVIAYNKRKDLAQALKIARILCKATYDAISIIILFGLIISTRTIWRLG